MQPPPNTIDPVVHAIMLLAKHGGRRSKIADEVGVKRQSMAGRKWAEFNKRFDQMKKSGACRGDGLRHFSVTSVTPKFFSRYLAATYGLTVRSYLTFNSA